MRIDVTDRSIRQVFDELIRGASIPLDNVYFRCIDGRVYLVWD